MPPPVRLRTGELVFDLLDLDSIEYGAVLVGTHNASHVDRWPLVAALCRALRIMPAG